MSQQADNAYLDILAFLRRVRRRLIAVVSATAVVGSVAAACFLGLAWIGVEAILYTSPGWRSAALSLSICTALAWGLRHVWRHLSGKLSRGSLGLLAEKVCPQLQERLTSSLELWDSARARRLYSTDLLAATLTEAARIAARLEPRLLVDWSHLRLAAKRLGLGGVVLAASLLLSDDMAAAAYRCIHPTREFARQARTQVTVQPGDVQAIKGDDVSLRIHLSGHLPHTAVVMNRETEELPWQLQEIVVEDGFFGASILGGRFVSARTDTLVYVFEHVRRSFVYRVVAGDGESAVHRVTVIDPPAVQKLRLHYTYPEYSGLAARVEEESGDIHSLPGTGVGFRIAASKPLSRAALVVDDTLRIPLEVTDNRAEIDLVLIRGTSPAAGAGAEKERTTRPQGPINLALEAGVSHRYFVELVDRGGVLNRDPIQYAIQVVEDLPPRIAITVPGHDADLPESMQLLLSLEVSDDFGIDRIDLLYRIGPEGGQVQLRLPLPGGDSRRIDLTHLWDLSDLDLLPEDRVFYRARAWDNDSIEGPKSAASGEYSLRYRSLYEIMEEVSQEQDEAVHALEELTHEERDAGEQLEEIRRELLRTEELTWEQKKELEAALDRQEERAQALAELAEQMAETAQKLQEQGLGSEEMLEKLQEIRELMASVTSPELQEALEDLRQAMDEMDPKELAAALKEFAQDQEAFQQRLDRTLELLRRVHAEQRLDAAVAQAADLEERQEQIDAALEQGQPDGDERLMSQEERLEGDTERLRQELADLAQAMKPFSPETASELAETSTSMQEQALTARMREMMQRMKAGERQQAQSIGKGVEEDLGELRDGLANLRGEFVASEKARILDELRQAMGDLVELSQRQEDLQRRAEEAPRSSLGAHAQEQFALLRGAGHIIDHVAQLGEQTLSLDTGLATTLGYALRNMRQAGQHLGQRAAGRAAGPQLEAMGYLNEAVLLLRQSADDVASSKMPSGFGEAMQKMMGLSEQQADLNQATQQTMGKGKLPGKQGRGRGDLLAEMARRAAEQQRIQQALRALERELRGHRGAQKRVERIERDMESVLRDMRQRKPDPRIAQAQQRILQRMLDASRSIHSRGFEKKRRSEVGTDQAYAGPVWLPSELGQSRDRWREAMKQALGSDYPREYLELIRRYYELVYQDLSESGAQTP
jgi:hypothetical protein